MNRAAFFYTNTKTFKKVLAIATALFMFLFLLFYQPFGVNNYRPDEKITFVLTGFLFLISFLVFLIIIFLEFIIRPLIINNTDTKRYISWLIIELVIISSATFMLYNLLGGFHDFYFKSYIKHIFEISTVLIIPIIGTFYYFKYTTVIKEYHNTILKTKNITSENDMVHLKGDYKKDKISLPVLNIVFIESEDNYVSLNYLENNVLKKYMIRSTLLKFEKQLHNNSIVRCNRSELVNLYHLESFKQESKKISIHLKNTSRVFILSKSNIKTVLLLLKK